MTTSHPAPSSLPCSRCGESVPDGFDACWRCGTRLPESVLEREPGPDFETQLAADRAADEAELRALASEPHRTSLRAQLVTGILAAFLSLAFTTGLVDESGEGARRILVDPRFWYTLMAHTAVLGVYLAGVALWRRARRSTAREKELAR